MPGEFSAAVRTFDANHDGRLSDAELRAAGPAGARLASSDADEDGFLSDEEYAAAIKSEETGLIAASLWCTWRGEGEVRGRR